MTKRVRAMVDPRPAEDEFAKDGERIARVVFPSGRACLISCRIRDDGAEEVVLYEADRGVRVYCETRAKVLTARRNRERKSA